MKSQLRIIVSGLVGLHPVGGMAWHYFQYLVGLARLGHDVYYHEDTWSWPYHPIENRQTDRGDYSANFIGDFVRRYAPDLQQHWHYLHLHEKSFGIERATFDKVARTADLFLNVSGSNFIPESLSPSCIKVFIDTDPGYNQILLAERPSWSPSIDRWCDSVAVHDRHFTFAENINCPDCLVPKLGFSWKTTRMPVVLDLWHPAAIPPRNGSPWSTIMTWNAFKGTLVYRGTEYKSKGPEFEKLIDVPRKVDVPLHVAVGGIHAPLEKLAQHGWHVLDGPQTTLTPDGYAEFIAGSRGEFSAAKNVYVAMRTGWFSERSTCYLACGKPVITQDTGFRRTLPVGEGLLTFTTTDEAIAAIGEVEKNYQRHANAARAIAEAVFGSDKVLTDLIKDALNQDTTRGGAHTADTSTTDGEQT